MNDKFISISQEKVLKRVQYLTSGETLIGRDVSCLIRLSNNLVSRKHAVIFADVDGLTIQDLKSRNGTFVNGQMIFESVPVKVDDEITIGPYILRIHSTIPSADGMPSDSEESTIGPLKFISPNGWIPDKQPTLTPAQTRILKGFLEGFSEKEIAAMLQLSKHTVHTHAKAIYRAYSVSSRWELLMRHIALNGGELQKPQNDQETGA